MSVKRKGERRTRLKGHLENHKKCRLVLARRDGARRSRVWAKGRWIIPRQAGRAGTRHDGRKPRRRGKTTRPPIHHLVEYPESTARLRQKDNQQTDSQLLARLLSGSQGESGGEVEHY
uniref:Uncharacterized protein n=1 Tax=Plectus sambesii TaxID=2011161 RepID=A0A914W7R2_9BILA